MHAVLKDLGLWFWRLAPANPILVRVVSAGGKRIRHLWIRGVYLAVLAAAVIIGVMLMQTGGSGSLAELAKNATQVFKYVSLLQLGMVCVLAPVFAAAAITQEKDSQTFNILLSTPLSNGQIVLGSLLSRLYFVFVLLLAGIPLFCIMMVYGGVTGDKIALSIALAGATALLTGTLAITISVIKIGTGRTVFSFYLAIAVYLIVVYSLAQVPALIPPQARPAPGEIARMSWLAAFHPFLALWVALGQTPAPDFGAVAHYGFPHKYLLAYPHYSYVVMSTLVSGLLILLSLFFVRRSTREGESSWLGGLLPSKGRRCPDDAAGDPDDTGGRHRRPRHVSRNPIAWRESVSSASAAGGATVRYLMVGIGVCIALVLLIYYATGSLTAVLARNWLYGVVAVEIGIALFVATTTAATSMTREKESNTIELVLATPLTSSQIIWGKIRGLIVAAWPMLLAPYLTILLFALYDLVKGELLGGDPVVFAEALLTLPILMVAFTAFVCVVGLRMSINQRKTLSAVFMSMLVLLVVFGVTGGCGAILLNAGSGELLTSALLPLGPFYAPMMVIDPAGTLAVKSDALTACRIIAFIAACCSAAVYAVVVLSLHKGMVRQFDMTIRKQMA